MPNDIEDLYPLSPMQQGLLFDTLLHGETAVYFEQLSCTLTGQLNVSAFKTAWRLAVERHAILRTAFIWEDLKEPMQFVQRAVTLPWAEHDWRGLPATEQQERLRDYRRQDRERGIALTKAPLMRLSLIRMSEQSYIFIWSHHHLLLDGWSSALLLQEILTAYQQLREGRHPRFEPSRQYGDYIEWLQQQNEKCAESFWRDLLAGFTAPTPLGLDRALTAQGEPSLGRSRQELPIPAALTQQLRTLAREQHVTLNTLAQGAWALLLSRYSRQEDVVFGATVAGRPASLDGVETILGNFINTLPVRVKVRPDAMLGAWLKELQEMYSEMRQYEYSSLVQIQGWSEVPRGLPLFESLLVFENYPTGSAFDAATWEEHVGLRPGDVRTDDLINLPLAIGVEPGAESGLMLVMVYDPRRFDDATIARMLGHLRKALEEFAINPQRPLKSVKFITDDERRRVLLEWNDTRRPYPVYDSVVQLFDEQVRRAPENTAVCFDAECLTYGELDARTNQLAHRLRQLGVGPDVPVGILMHRSLEMVSAILGILKAGGAYLPLDPTYPRERLVSMLEESGAPVLLTMSRLTGLLPDAGVRLLCLDACADSLAEESIEPPPVELSGSNLAYVIYTSGSTGRPKGVMNTHEGILNRLLWMQETFRLTEADCVLQKTPYSFDVSVWEFLWPLLTGARLVVAPPEAHQDSSHLVRLIAERQVTIIHFVPSMLRVLLDEKGLEQCRSLRHVICSGEALPVELEKLFYERSNARLHNLYGPTEAAIDVTAWSCIGENAWSSVPIGRPIANTQIYLLDAEGEPVPVGVAGELHIGGANLARGYLARAELTAEKFIPNAFAEAPGARLYRTGDIARFHADGWIEFLGRADAQVKIRGFRVELGEIENTLARFGKVREVVVIATEATGGDKRLIAYLVLAPGMSAHVAELRRFLEQKLPAYMVPSDFVFLDALPLTSSGKIDRRRLLVPERDRAKIKTPYVPPSTPAEEELASMWRELLGLSRVGTGDNFFELGGHSLVLMQLVMRINEAFQVQIPLRAFFDARTIAEMTTLIAAWQMEHSDPDEVALMLEDLNNLSPDEVRALLEAESGMGA